MLHLQITFNKDWLIDRFYFVFPNKHYNIKIEK